MGPRALDELLSARKAPLLSVCRALAYHAPSAEVLEFTKNLRERDRGKPPEGRVTACCHHLYEQLLVLRTRKQLRLEQLGDHTDPEELSLHLEDCLVPPFGKAGREMYQ